MTDMKAPKDWDLEADVLVVGFGGAGSAAAIEAHDGGAEVMILEKASEVGGSTAMCGGAASIPSEHVDLKKAVSYLVQCGKGVVNERIAEAWVKEAANTPDWMEGLGARLEVRPPPHPSLIGGDHKNYDGYDQVRIGVLPGGQKIFGVLKKAVEDRGIKVYVDTRANKLIRNDNDEVIGIRALQRGRTIYAKGRKATVLTCGGFGHNEEMKRSFLRIYPSYFVGAHSCTGDGIIMGQAIGAALNKMNEEVGILVHHFPGFRCGWNSNLQEDAGRRPCIIVNKYGRRFANEQLSYDPFDKALIRFDPTLDDWTNIPAYVIFDEKARLMGPVAGTVSRPGEYAWSQDNTVEIEKGWIKKADTIGQLADIAGIDNALIDTVSRFNGFCKKGVDLDFSRKLGLIPLDTPPFYSIEAHPGFYDTVGGLKINEKAQVIDVFGDVIPRLYAAGTTANGIVGFYYPISGSAVGDTLVFGRLAGRNAALEKF